MTSSAEISAILREAFPFWEHLDKTEQDLLVNHARRAHYRAGAPIHSGDGDCVGVLIIQEGSVRTYITSPDGREITLFRLGEGEVCVLSASCVLQSITFDVHVDTASDCSLLQINSQVFSGLAGRNVYVEAYTYRQATERFSEVMWTMQQILFMSFDKRLAIFLTDEAARTGSDTIRMTQEQIARETNSAREVVTRMLSYFSREGYVELFRGGVRLTDKKGLRKLASG